MKKVLDIDSQESLSGVSSIRQDNLHSLLQPHPEHVSLSLRFSRLCFFTYKEVLLSFLSFYSIAVLKSMQWLDSPERNRNIVKLVQKSLLESSVDLPLQIILSDTCYFGQKCECQYQALQLFLGY